MTNTTESTTESTTQNTTVQPSDPRPNPDFSSEINAVPVARPIVRRARPIALALLSLTLGACGATTPAASAGGGATTPAASADGGAGTTGGDAGAPSASVEETLSRLGVPLDTSARLDPNGQPVAANFDPLGSGPGNNTVIEKKDELFAMGSQFSSNGASFFSLLGGAAPTLMGSATGSAPPPWALATGGFIRAAAAGDVDGDGRQEMIVVSADGPNATEIDLSIIENAKAPTPFSYQTTKLASASQVQGLALAAADFDGDQKIDIVVGVSSSVPVAQTGGGNVMRASVELLFFKGNGDGTFTPDTADSKALVTASVTGPTQAALVLAPAELDGDLPSELALVVNDSYDENGATTYTSHYYVYDDATTQYAALGDGIAGTTGAPIASADLAAGDIDGDGLDELVLGGPSAIATGCSVNMVAVALDDAVHHLAPIGLPHGFSVDWGNCSGDGSGDPTISWAPVRMLQADGDGTTEVLVGDTIFENMSGFASLPSYPNVDPFVPMGKLPGVYIPYNNTRSNKFNPTTAAVVIATAQQSASSSGAADEIFVYTQDYPAAIVAYTPSCDGSTCTITPGIPLPVTATSSTNTATYPILVPVDVTGETVVLQRSSSDLTHQLIFTEPLVIATMAAPPCENGIGQNTDACVSTYGIAATQGNGNQYDESTQVGVTAGINIEAEAFDADVKRTFTAKATLSTAKAYNLTQQVTYNSGSMEDSVIFSTVPYDQYHYTVVSGGTVGSPVTVSVPRVPVVLIAERGFYNSTIVPGGLVIGNQVFQHKIGDISTYPKASDESALAATTSSGVLVGLQTCAVGQGTGSTTISDEVDRSSTLSASVEFDSELSVEATAGVAMGGFSIGTSMSDTLSVSMGQNTSFSGTVGSIDAAHFSDNFYQFNMFAYTQTDATSGRQFQVVNYWVQQQ